MKAFEAISKELTRYTTFCKVIGIVHDMINIDKCQCIKYTVTKKYFFNRKIIVFNKN